jgi:hypothetical protein
MGADLDVALLARRENVEFAALGDDNISTISEEASVYYNFQTIQASLARINIEYTPADKSEGSYTTRPVATATICKRRWVFDEEYLIWKCPIEKASITKMLTIGIPPSESVMSKKDYRWARLKSALPEVAQYGREEYNEKVEIFKQVIDRDFPYPTYEQLMEAQKHGALLPWVPYERVVFTDELEFLAQRLQTQNAKLSPLVTGLSTMKHLERWSRQRFGEECGTGYLAGMAVNRPSKPSRDGRKESAPDVFEQIGANRCGLTQPQLDAQRVASNNPESGESASENVDTQNAANFSVSVTTENETTRETAVFRETPATYSLNINANRDPSYNDSDTLEVPLATFLSRPVRIYEGVWSAGYDQRNVLLTTISPWTLWQDDARVKAKLTNFAYLSCDLKLRIMLNGNPFQYGRLMFTYIPYGTSDLSTDVVIDDKRNQVASMAYWEMLHSSASGRQEVALRHFSTYPTVGLNPATNEVAEMHLPFIWHNNYLKVNGYSGVSRQSPGDLCIYDRNPLRIANPNSATSVNYTIYAWAENVKLIAPTEFEPVADEYRGGMSSKATAVAKAANMLNKVPVIGPFARATEIGAGAAADIAKLFGFSTPRVLEQSHQVTPRAVGRVSTVVGEDNSTTLALDPKQEVTVDSRVVGGDGTDEMTFKSIMTREQWLVACEWFGDVGQLSSVSGLEKLLFASLVSPTHQLISGASGGATIYPNKKARMDCPGGHISEMFAYWRGSITYRVEVVCSKMHAGRLKLQFDPFMRKAARTAASFQTEDINARFTAVLDLSEASEMEFTIPYTSYRPWLRTNESTDYSTYCPYRQDNTGADFNLESVYDENVHMGIFTVSIVNELVATMPTTTTASSTTAPVQINIFMKCGEDMEFAQPNDYLSNWPATTYEPIAAMSSKTMNDEEVPSVDEHRLTTTKLSPNAAGIFFGESVVSVRTLAKRYMANWQGYIRNATPTKTASDCIGIAVYVKVPPFHFSSKNSTTHQNVYQTVASYMAPCYICMRGATRWKAKVAIKGTGNGYSTTPALLGVDRNSERSAVVFNDPTYERDWDDNYYYLSFPSGHSGGHFIHPYSNGVIEWELPWYSNTRFRLATNFRGEASSGSGSSQITTIQTNPTLDQLNYSRLCINNGYGRENFLDLWAAVGEDFNLSFFTGVPIKWQD